MVRYGVCAQGGVALDEAVAPTYPPSSRSNQSATDQSHDGNPQQHPPPLPSARFTEALRLRPLHSHAIPDRVACGQLLRLPQCARPEQAGREALSAIAGPEKPREVRSSTGAAEWLRCDIVRRMQHVARDTLGGTQIDERASTVRLRDHDAALQPVGRRLGLREPPRETIASLGLCGRE